MANPDAFDDMWSAFEFCATEALLLRSFLEYLRSYPDPPEKKREKLQNWQKEIGLQLGNPTVSEQAKQLVQRLRDAPPEVRADLLRDVLNSAYSIYFGEKSS